MDQKKYKYIIIGGGLSGLSAALQFKLNGEENFLILEARNRTGGRILTTKEVDLGATWVHHNHSTLFNVLDFLGIDKFKQHTSGKSLYVVDSASPAQEFEIGENEPPSYRIKGGTSTLITAISEKLKDKIELNRVVHEVIELNETVQVKTNNETLIAEKVIITIPPRLASTLTFLPSLPQELHTEMKATHTWFSHAIKVGITYEKAFWRKQGNSGMLINQTGDVIEIHDHTNEAENHFSLMGFVNERLREATVEEQKEKIISTLEVHFGKEVRNYLDFKLYDWSVDDFTTGSIGITIPRKTEYGHPVFQRAYYNDKLFFAGTETSKFQGGFMEGAVYSGLSLAQQLLKS